MADQSLYLYQNIIEEMNTGILAVDTDGKILMGNDAIRRHLGMKGELVGRSVADVFYESESERYDYIVDSILDAVHNGSTTVHSATDCEIAGESRQFLIATRSIFRDKKRIGVVLTLEDISELSEYSDAAHASEEIRRLNESIVRRNELIKKTYGEALSDKKVEKLLEDDSSSLPVDSDRKVIVSLRGVTKEFTSGDRLIRILRGIDLDIYEHEFLVILGESGCGKSTMMNIIGGMDFLTEGELIVEGEDYSHPNEDDLVEFRRNYVGFVFQSYNLMPNLTALENVSFIAEISKDPISASDAIEKVGLTDRANNYPSQMSGGQQQRVSIARALVKNPTLILADEPTAALDYDTSIEVLTVIEDVVRQQGKTVVMITHNDEIAKMADRVVRLKDGKVSATRVNLHPLSAKELIW